MSLGRLNPPQSPGEGLQVTNFDHCLHIAMVIMKCTDVFRGTFSRWGGVGRGEGYVGRSFHGGIYYEGR